MNEYPSDAVLQRIKDWPVDDVDGALAFVQTIWHWPDCGVAADDGVLYLATGGWSGNEEIIGAMRENIGIWCRWICSSRGGAHEFELHQAAPCRETRFQLARRLERMIAEGKERVAELGRTNGFVVELSEQLKQREQSIRTLVQDQGEKAARILALEARVESNRDLLGQVRLLADERGHAIATLTEKWSERRAYHRMQFKQKVAAMREVAIERDQLKAAVAAMEEERNSREPDTRLFITLTDHEKKLSASEAECVSWRKVLEDERAHAQQRLKEMTQERDDAVDAREGTFIRVDGLRVELAAREQRVNVLREEVEHYRNACQSVGETDGHGWAETTRELRSERDQLKAAVTAQSDIIERLDKALQYYAKTAISANAVRALHDVEGMARRAPGEIGLILEEYLEAHIAWSAQTFGQGVNTERLCNHIRKELEEIAAEPHDLEEWIDVLILAFDGAWRAGYRPRQICNMLIAKKSKNKNRVYRVPADPTAPMEHDRSLDAK